MNLFDSLNSLADVDALIASGQRESETLEYKTASKRLQQSDHAELAKDVSAFANSSGGLLIYGVVADPSDKGKPLKREAIDPSNAVIIEQVLGTHVRHPIQALRTKTLPASGPAEVLLVDVPESPLAPHQVITDKRYYRRQSADNVPMSHDLVELFFGRRQGPVLEPRVQIGKLAGDPGRAHAGPLYIVINLVNIGQRVARSVLVRIIFPANGCVHAYEVENCAEEINRPGARILSLATASVLFYPSLPTGVSRMKWTAEKRVLEPSAVACWLDLYAEEMQARRYSLRVEQMGLENFSGVVTYTGLPPDPMMEYG